MIMTKAAFAVRMGVDRAQPTRWAARGMPVLDDGRVDCDAAETWVARNIDSKQRRRRNPPSPAAQAVVEPPFECMQHLTEHGDRIAVLMAMTLVYRLPSSSPVAALGAGGSLDLAREMLPAVQIAAMQEAEQMLDAAGVPPPPGFDTWVDAPVWDLDRFVDVNWTALERLTAERVAGAPPAWRLSGDVHPKPSKSRGTGK